MSSRQPAPTASLSAGGGRLRPSWFVVGCLAAALASDGWATERAEALRICPRFEGFIALPGTDTCLRIEGEAGLDLFAHGSHVKDERFDGDPFVIAGRPTRRNRVSFEPSASVSFDTRTATAFGTLRTSLELSTDSDDDRSFGAGGPSRGPGGRGRDEGRSALEIDTARVQLGGFTAGLTDSFFGIANPVNYLGTHIADFGEEQILLGYTADLAKDLSASVAIESGEEADDEDGLFDYVLIPRRNADDLTDERLQTPVGVANLRFEQSWGAAQVSGAVSQTQTRLFSEERPFDNRKDVAGWAVAGGVALNLPQWGEDDALVLKAATSRALSFYTIGAGGNVVWTDLDALRTVDVLTLFAGLVHDWTPTLQSNVGVGFARVNFNLPNGRDRADGLTVTGNLVWSPVENLDFGLELIYARVDADRVAARLLETTDERKGVFGALLRIERSFGP
jgi:Porin subfamily